MRLRSISPVAALGAAVLLAAAGDPPATTGPGAAPTQAAPIHAAPAPPAAAPALPAAAPAPPAAATAPASDAASNAAPAAVPVGAPAKAAPDQLVVLFGNASADIGPKGAATLDTAAHLYRAGNPIVMIVTGTTDATGNPRDNLTLSERRARAVLDGLVARGIPVAKLQLLAAGSTDPAVRTASAAAENRRAVITWR